MKAKTISVNSIVGAIALLIIGFSILPAQKASAQDSELRVLSSDGMQAALTALTPKIETSIGRKLKSQFDSSKNLVDKVKAGETFDVALLTTATIDELIKDGKIAPDSRVDIGRAGVGIGIRAGAPKPDISTPEALKQTLLKAKHITFNSTGATVAVLNKVFDRLGIAEEMKSKSVPDSISEGAQKKVISGQADVILILIPEVNHFPGVDYIGPLPGDLQSYINFVAGISTSSQDPEKAKALIRFIASPAAVSTLKDKGMEPH